MEACTHVYRYDLGVMPVVDWLMHAIFAVTQASSFLHPRP